MPKKVEDRIEISVTDFVVDGVLYNYAGLKLTAKDIVPATREKFYLVADMMEAMRLQKENKNEVKSKA